MQDFATYTPSANYYAMLKSTLYSYNNGALYHRNGKANPQFLVSDMAYAISQLNAEIFDDVKRKRYAQVGEIFEKIVEVTEIAQSMRLSREVNEMVTQLQNIKWVK